MNPSLLRTEGVGCLSWQGAIISLNIYYFGDICLHLQAVETSPPTPTIPSSAQGAFLDVCKGRLLRTSRPFSVFKKNYYLSPPPPKKKPPEKKFIYQTSSRTSCWLCTRLCQDGAYTGFTQKYFRRVKTALSQNFIFGNLCTPSLDRVLYITSKDVHRSSKNI